MIKFLLKPSKYFALQQQAKPESPKKGEITPEEEQQRKNT
jgi:hypothetical protein